MKPWNNLERLFFAAFLFWSAAGLVFEVFHLTPDMVARWDVPYGIGQLPSWVGPFVQVCLQVGDPVLIVLAFANTHLHAARQWSAGLARRWAFTILIAAYLIESIGVVAGVPFGIYQYTDKFGLLLGQVPFTIPLAWHVVVTNALFVVRAVTPVGWRVAEVTLTGLLCMAYDYILEPFATVVKNYWVWSGGEVPSINYLAWFAISSLMVLFFAPAATTLFRFDPRPWLILGLTSLIFVIGTYGTSWMTG